MSRVYGGLHTTNLRGLEKIGELRLGRDPYEYFISMTELGKTNTMKIPSASSLAIVVIDGEASLCIAGKDFAVGAGNILTAYADADISVDCTGRVLVAYQQDGAEGRSRASLLRPLSESKFVDKPWGHERWLVPDDGSFPFMFKEISINPGFRTSLQYHRQKRETNLVYDGSVELTYSNERMPVDPPGYPSTESVRLDGPTVVDVHPLHLHRLTALTNILLYEISTPEVDDVIRISDDSNRGHGRIASEHTSK